MSSLQGKVALVTGATGGLGSEICRALAEQGATVVAGYNSSVENAKVLVETLPNGQNGHSVVKAPVTDSAALSAMATEIEQNYGRCDVLVNCAGTTQFVEHEDLDGLDDALIDRILTTNVRGPFAVTRVLKPLLLKADGAVVINISSIAAKTAMGSNVIYCASKAALDNMTMSLARALAPDIRVVSVAPGLVDTDFVKKMDQSWRDEQAQRTPLKRLAQPNEIAQAVCSVVTGLTFMTGAVIAVDGGRPLT